MQPNAVKVRPMSEGRVYPLGYYGGGQTPPQDTHETREGDPEVVALWERYTHVGNYSQLWDFRSQVIRVAKRLFTETPNWFTMQDRNPWVREYNYLFIVDTLRFIATGQRRIDIYTWPDLITYYPDAQSPRDIGGRRQIADQIRELNIDTKADRLIQLWLSHRGGFDDMMNTLRILFGDLPVRKPQR